MSGTRWMFGKRKATVLEKFFHGNTAHLFDL